jgi:serine/threonine-protein kinase
MAKVFLGELRGDGGFARAVAIKIAHPGFASDTEFSKALLDEARIAVRIRHVNVVSMLDVVEHESELALVMDYVHGESLSRLLSSARLREQRVPHGIAVAIVLDVLRGLHAAHETTDERGVPLEVVHRDVSPQNVLVGIDGVTRITDFGVAKARGRLLTTRDGALKGKLAYMAPEQLRGGIVTRQADVYAAAVLLWEMLAGVRLFRSENEGEVVQRVLFDVVAAPGKRVQGIPAGLDDIVMRGLARETNDRYASALEMATALERSGVGAATPREVGAWVEVLCDDSLFERQKTVARIEASPGSGSDVRSAIKSREGEPLGALDATATTLDSAKAPRSFRRRSLLWPLAGFATLAAIVLAFASSRGSFRSPIAQEPASGSASSPPAPSASSQTALDPPLAPAPTEAASAPPTATASATVPRARALPAHPSPTKARSAKADCETPYTRDSSGKVTFKRECL